MNSPPKTTKSVALVAGLATAAAIGLYFILKRSSKKKASNVATTSRKKLTEQETDNIIRQIKITYSGKFISVDSAIAIAAACKKVSSSECDRLLTAHRKIRLDNKDNLALYVRECEAFFNTLSQVERREANKVLERLNLSEYTFEQTLNYYDSRGEPKIRDLQNILLRADAKEINFKILPLDGFRTVLIRMTELFEAERVNVPNIKRLLNNPQYVGEVIIARVSDIIYKEFGVEQENFNMAFAVHHRLFASQEPEIFKKYSKIVNSVVYG